MAARARAGLVSLLLLTALAVGSAPQTTAAVPHQTAPRGFLRVSIDAVGDGLIHPKRPLVLRGTVTNPGRTTWLNVQAYLQISSEPATDQRDLAYFASVPDNPGLGNVLYNYGQFAMLGDVAPLTSKRFRISIPYDELGIAGTPGVYRVGVKVIAATLSGFDPADAVFASTLVPLLPPHPRQLTPAQTVTLLPLTAPVKRLGTGPFADDSLRNLLAPPGRLSEVVDWGLRAPPRTLQLLLDPALLDAVRDMADGYRIRPPSGSGPPVPGQGVAVAIDWLQRLRQLERDQYVLLSPWGNPAADATVSAGLLRPVSAAVAASRAYLDRDRRAGGVAGWVDNGSVGMRVTTLLHRTGVDAEIVSAASLPHLARRPAAERRVPSSVTVTTGGRRIHALVVFPALAGLPTSPTTTPLQFRQRLLADATVRSMNGRRSITVTALPARWNPGPQRGGSALGQAFATPVLVAQSAIGALDRRSPPYDGSIRATGNVAAALTPPVLDAARRIRTSGGHLAAVSRPISIAADFDRVLATAVASQWERFPRLAVELMSEQSARDRSALRSITLTGPPFVAMSSDSGRFPLTVTNGLERAIRVTIQVDPADPALAVGPLPSVRVSAGQRRDVQVTTTATGSGVTSVAARLATPDGSRFGRPWRFDVRSTQIGLVIWVVMGVGGVVLLGASGYRIVNRVRGRDASRAPTAG